MEISPWRRGKLLMYPFMDLYDFIIMRLLACGENWRGERDASATSHPTNAQSFEYHYLSIFQFLLKYKKQELFVYICFLLEGNFDIDAGDGWVGWGGVGSI